MWKTTKKTLKPILFTNPSPWLGIVDNKLGEKTTAHHIEHWNPHDFTRSRDLMVF